MDDFNDISDFKERERPIAPTNCKIDKPPLHFLLKSDEAGTLKS